MALAQSFPLHDGRTLGFDDVGDPGGVAVFFVHGTPDSRRSRHPDDGLATALGIRLVAVDRPGIGLSSPDRGFTVGSFAEDVATLAEALGIDTWATFGWSAGAPFALAMAARHPDRVHRVAVAAGLVPFAAYVTPGILDDADGGRHMVAELGAELGPTATAEMAAPMSSASPTRPRSCASSRSARACATGASSRTAWGSSGRSRCTATTTSTSRPDRTSATPPIRTCS